jgi:hypothetical protein
MERTPEPISKDDAWSAIVCGAAVLLIVVMVAWRWMLE